MDTDALDAAPAGEPDLATAPLRFDWTPPTGSIRIDPAVTRSRAVTLTLAASDPSGVTSMRLSNDGASFAAAIAYAPTAGWTLLDGDGGKTVYVRYRDGAGNWSGAMSASATLDTHAPVLAAVSASPPSSTATTISWTTNEAATSAVDYGTTISYGQSAPVDPTLRTSHGVALGGLAPATTYHFRVRSADAAGNEVLGGDAILTTAPASGGGTRTVVAVQQIHQDWGVARWSASSVVLANVAAGDAIVVLGLYWNSNGPAIAPSDSNGQLRAAVNQAPSYAHPPVVAQIYYELGAAPGSHTIVPPDLGGGGGDGTLYVIQVRGVASLVAVGDTHVDGTALPSVSTRLASAALAGDLVVAIGGEDNTQVFANAGMSHPAGWQPLGVQNDGAKNVPSEACYRLAPASGDQLVQWRWDDPNANVTGAAIAAFR